jgi:hypothetical protein
MSQQSTKVTCEPKKKKEPLTSVAEVYYMIDDFCTYVPLGHVSDWSILYVVIVLFTSVLLVVGCGWGVISLCQRACARRPHKRQRYSLLDEGENDAMIPRGKASLQLYA